jgi:hypothetical protein
LLAARPLGEFGDDPHRYASAKGRKNYTATSPVTRASGKKKTITAMYARNAWISDTIHWWAFCSLNASPGAVAYKDELRARAKSHTTALRQVGNRLVGVLHGCLKTGTGYDEHTACGHRYASPSQPPPEPAPFRALPARSCSPCGSAASVKVGRRPPAGFALTLASTRHTLAQQASGPPRA